MKSFDYIVGASAVSVGFAAYLTYFVGIPATTSTLVVIATVWPLILMLLNLKGIKEASWDQQSPGCPQNSGAADIYHRGCIRPDSPVEIIRIIIRSFPRDFPG